MKLRGEKYILDHLSSWQKKNYLYTVTAELIDEDNGTVEDFEIIGIYSTIDKALEIIKAKEKDEWWSDVYFCIEPFEIDK